MAQAERGSYDSGGDIVLEYGDLRFTYSETDFGQRAEVAARTLEIVDGRLEEGEVQDLVCLVTEGSIPIEEPVSAFGEYINDNQNLIRPDVNSKGTLVHWLRRLIFRGSWLDQRIKEGELRPRFNPDSGDFDYVQPGPDDETGQVIELAPAPSWRYVAYDAER